MSWKLPGKLLCITLFFTSFHWYNIVVYFTKKNAFQSTKNFRRIQWQNMLRMHLLQSRISKFSLSDSSPTCVCGTQLSPYFINWDSYFNSFWEPCICDKSEMKQVISPRGVIWIFQNGGNFAWNRVFSFSQLFCLFWEIKKLSSEIHVFRSDQFSLLMYRCLLPLSVTVKMDYEENMENARCATNWWHSFMNQRLNYLVLLYKKCIILCCCIKSVLSCVVV